MKNLLITGDAMELENKKNPRKIFVAVIFMSSNEHIIVLELYKL